LKLAPRRLGYPQPQAHWWQCTQGRTGRFLDGRWRDRSWPRSCRRSRLARRFPSIVNVWIGIHHIEGLHLLVPPRRGWQALERRGPATTWVPSSCGWLWPSIS